MSRLPNMTNRADVPEGLLDAYDQVAGDRHGTVSGPYGVLLHSPELAVRGAALSNYLRWDSYMTAYQRELAILVAARKFDAAVMWAGHVRLGRDAGIADETIERIANHQPLSEFSAEDAEIVGYVRELLETNRVAQPTFDALRARLGDRGIVDITGLVGYYAFVAATLNAFEIEPPGNAVRLPG